MQLVLVVGDDDIQQQFYGIVKNFWYSNLIHWMSRMIWKPLFIGLLESIYFYYIWVSSYLNFFLFECFILFFCLSYQHPPAKCKLHSTYNRDYSLFWKFINSIWPISISDIVKDQSIILNKSISKYSMNLLLGKEHL